MVNTRAHRAPPGTGEQVPLWLSSASAGDRIECGKNEQLFSPKQESRYGTQSKTKQKDSVYGSRKGPRSQEALRPGNSGGSVWSAARGSRAFRKQLGG